MLPLNRSSLTFLSICSLILLAGCEDKKQPQPQTDSPSDKQAAPAAQSAGLTARTAAQNTTNVSKHIQYIPISSDSITTLTTKQTHAMEVGRNVDLNDPSTFPDAEYWLAFGIDEWHTNAGSTKTIPATVTFDTSDKSITDKLGVASMEVISGWALTIRPYQYPRHRTVRISSGSGVRLKEGAIARLELNPDQVVGMANFAIESSTRTIASPDAEPLNPEILIYRYVPSGSTAPTEDWVLYRPVSGASKNFDFQGYKADGTTPTKQTTLKPGYWAIYNFSKDEWVENKLIPVAAPTSNDTIHQLLRHVKSQTNRSFYHGEVGNALLPSSTNPNTPADSTPK